jgi:hypothetical protein
LSRVGSGRPVRGLMMPRPGAVGDIPLCSMLALWEYLQASPRVQRPLGEGDEETRWVSSRTWRAVQGNVRCGGCDE